jgi:hypothetical protein
MFNDRIKNIDVTRSLFTFNNECIYHNRSPFDSLTLVFKLLIPDGGKN